MPDSYFDNAENMLLKNYMDFAGMTNQIGSKSKTKEWKVVRNYTAKFSCVEAVERLIKIHGNRKESAHGE